MNKQNLNELQRNNYNEQLEQSLLIKLKDLIKELPDCCQLYFRGIEPTTSIKTRIAYAFDLRIFFYFLSTEISIFYPLTPKDFTPKNIEQVTPLHIEQFLEFLTLYSLPHYKDPSVMIPYRNNNRGKARKLATLRSFY